MQAKMNRPVHNPPPNNLLNRINNAVISGVDNPAILMLIFTLVYVIAEGHNLNGFAQLMHEAGINWAYALPVAMGLFIFCCYWLIAYYKAKDHSTFWLWAIVIMFTLGSGFVNVIHANGTIGGYTLAVLAPSIILFAGILVKDLIGKQASEQEVIQTIKDLFQSASNLTHEKQSIEANLKKLKTEHQVLVETHKAELQRLVAEVKAQQVRLTQARNEVAQTKKYKDKPNVQWVQAFQGDALIAAGYTKEQTSDILTIAPNTLNKRLNMVNGQSLIGKVPK